MLIFLTGYRATGKTTVGAILASRLGYECIDSDDEIEKRAGQSIAAIFAQQGEEHFRDLESEIVASLAQRDNAVVALGGGAILRQSNRDQIREHGTAVWLEADIETIQRRLSNDPLTTERRPNLTEQGLLQEVRQVLAERTPLYRASADLTIHTDNKQPESIADEIRLSLGI